MHIMKTYSQPEHINVGSGVDLTIRDLAKLIADAVGFEGRIVTDLSRPDGPPRKLMSVEKLERLGWKPQVSLIDGIVRTYYWYLEHTAEACKI